MGRMGKTLKNLLYASVFTAAASFLPSCEKDEPPIEPPKDTTPPKINIISPLEQKVYDSDTISFEWKIIEDNFKSAWYSIDNEQTKTPIIEKSGKKDLILPNASYNIVVYADDNSNNFSRESASFSVDKPPEKYIVNPFIQPNDSTLNWYGSGDVDNDNLPVNRKDLDRLVEVISGTYSNPSDTRLYDRADVNGDAVVNNDDLQLLAKKLNGTILYLPGEWNLLMTRAEREDWLRKMLAIDKTDEIPWTPTFDCTIFAYLTTINFRGYGSQKDISNLLQFYPFNFSDNCRFNLPLYELQLVAYNSNKEPIRAHDVNAIFVGEGVVWEDLIRIEPQKDIINDPIGQGFLDTFGTNSKLYIRGPPIISIPPGGITSVAYITYNVENNIPTLDSISSDIYLVTQREK